MSHAEVVALRVADEQGRRQLVKVLRRTYHQEKHWVRDPEAQVPPDDMHRQDISWFMVTLQGRPAGVLRLFYDPPLAQYAKYGFKILDSSVRVEDLVNRHCVAEIGRFAVIPELRGQFTVAAALMRAAAEETLARGYTHFVTDVFEDDPHSPYGFHTRVMGFHPIATHDVGELHCASRRITLVLDLKAAYKRLKARGNWMFRYLTGHWDEALHQQLAT